MLQAPMLLSNASPLNDDARRIPHNFHQYSYSESLSNPCSDVQYIPPELTKDDYSGERAIRHTRHVPLQDSSQPSMPSHRTTGYHGTHAKSARNGRVANYLYHRFRTSDQYVKYRERQQNGKSRDQKWPDHLEVAFFQALVRWPPMGRSQLEHKGKRQGRNELIADHIEEVTGEKRDRKQISSHIQVLKPWVQHDPFIMKWLSQRHRKDLRPPLHYEGTETACDAAISAIQPSRSSASGLPASEMQKIMQAKHLLEVFEPTDFSMFVQRKYADPVSDVETTERLHTYTSNILCPLQVEQQIADEQSFQHDFSMLYSLHQRRPLDCNILLAEASIGFPGKSFKDADGVALPGIELGVSFLCSSRHLPLHATLKCQNTFYKDARLFDHCSTDICLAQLEDGAPIETQLKFGSSFWAKTLASMAQKLSNSDDAVLAREEVARHINSIAVTQEIFVMTDVKPERLLVIHWNFRLSQVEQGRAYWMRVLLPPTLEHTAEPRCERMDSVYDNSNEPSGIIAATSSSQGSYVSHPTLQSPFEYEDGAANSAIVSATTWPDSSLDYDSNIAPPSVVDWHEVAKSNTSFILPVEAAGDNMTCDLSLNFSTLDSTAFNFDAATDFAALPALPDYSQDFVGQNIYDYPQQQQSQSRSTTTGEYASWYADFQYAPEGEIQQQQSVPGARNGSEGYYALMGPEAHSQGYHTYGPYEQYEPGFDAANYAGSAAAASYEAQAYSGARDEIV